MKFNPISIIPEQKRSTTPDVFITDQYGKLPALNGDGPLTINEAIRISKIINGYVPAFVSNNNRVTGGFYIDASKVYIDDLGDLVIKIPPGTGVIHNMIFNIPINIESKIEHFTASIPPDLPKGRVIIYISYKDNLENIPLRPLPQDYPHYPTTPVPGDQSDYNPISICYAFYNPETGEIIGSDWDDSNSDDSGGDGSGDGGSSSGSGSGSTTEDKIIISANIEYSKNDDGTVSAAVNEKDSGSILINGVEYLQQGGGFYDFSEVDGGEIHKTIDDSVATVQYNGIQVLFNGPIKDSEDSITLSNSGFDPLVFYNGMLYYQMRDWKYGGNSRDIIFTNNVLNSGRRSFIYQNVPKTEKGYMEIIYTARITQNSTSLDLEGLDPSNKYLVFIDGFLQSDYAISKNKLASVNLKIGGWIIIIQIHQGEFVSLIYSGNAPRGTLYKAYGINNGRKYLVFYNGVLYLEEQDYKILPNTLSMNLPMNPNKNLTIIGV